MVTLGDAAARGAGVTLGTQLVRALLQMASVVVLARLLTPADFGLVAMVAAVIGIAEIVRDFGLSSAAVQAPVLTDDERTNLFWVNVALGVACAAAAVAARPAIVALYGEERLSPVVLALSSVFVLSGLNAQFRTELTRRLGFRALAASDVIAQVCGIAVGVTLAVAGAGLWAIVAQQITAAAVAAAVNALTCPWSPGLPRRGVSLRRFFRYGGGVLGTQAVGYVTKNVDNVALGAIWGAGPLGLYSRAYQLLMTPLNQINAPMTRVALPVLSRVQHDDEVFLRYLGRAQLVGCYLTATVFAVAAGLAGPVVLLLFGPRWSAVAPIFAVLAVGGVFRAVSQLAYWIYLSRGRTGAQLRQESVTRPLMVLVILAGLPWGAVGVAAGHSVAYLLYWLVSLLHAGHVEGIDVRPLLRQATRAILLFSAPCGLAAFAAATLVDPAWARLVVGLAAAGGYAALAVAVVPALRADAVVVVSVARRAVGRR